MSIDQIDVGTGSDVLDDDFLFYSHFYSAITVLFAMGVLSKFLTDEFKFGAQSFVTLVVLFLGEPLCHVLLRGPGGVLAFALACWVVYGVLPGASTLAPSGRAVLITGCDSGFGHALAVSLDSLGMTVFAGCLSSRGAGATQLRSSCSDKLRVLQLDVTSDKQIADAVGVISDSVSDTGLWGVVNNAGLCYIGELEMTSECVHRKLLEVNLFGVIRVTKAFLPLVRQARGRVVNMSSLSGRIGFEGFGAYGVSKFGVEAYSDVLRLEMSKWGVKVISIQPTGFRTASMDEGTLSARAAELWSTLDPPTRLVYGQPYLQRAYDTFSARIPSFPSDLAPVVGATRAALLARSPRGRYAVGQGATALLGLHALLPVGLADRLARLCSSAAVTDMRPAAMEQ